MNFTEEQIEIRPGHEMRDWQSCDYYVGRTALFHERTYFPRGLFGRVRSEQWTHCSGPRSEIQPLADKWGGACLAEFYAPDGADAWFLAFSDSEKALAFCRSEDFDRFLTTEKLTP